MLHQTDEKITLPWSDSVANFYRGYSLKLMNHTDDNKVKNCELKRREKSHTINKSLESQIFHIVVVSRGLCRLAETSKDKSP